MGVEVLEIGRDLLCIRRRSYFTCSYLLRQGRSITLIDAGMKTDGSDVLAGLRHWGARLSDVGAIFVTHWHNDHAAGAAFVASESKCRVYYTRAEGPALRRETASLGLAGRLSDAIPETGPLVLAKGLLSCAPMVAVDATRHVEDGEWVEGLRVLHTPGHTSGHLSVYDAENKVLFAGDALAVVDDELRYMARAVTEDQHAARRSMQRCAALDLTWVCPGHRTPKKMQPGEIEAFRNRLEGDAWPALG